MNYHDGYTHTSRNLKSDFAALGPNQPPPHVGNCSVGFTGVLFACTAPDVRLPLRLNDSLGSVFPSEKFGCLFRRAKSAVGFNKFQLYVYFQTNFSIFCFYDTFL